MIDVVEVVWKHAIIAKSIVMPHDDHRSCLYWADKTFEKSGMYTGRIVGGWWDEDGKQSECKQASLV